MSHSEIRLEQQSASEHQIHSHLLCCDRQFVPRLSHRVDLAVYSKKIFERARTFEAFRGPRLVGLVAMYLDETVPPKGYITNVSVLAEYSGQRIAETLLSSCLSHARKSGARNIALEVHSENRAAIGLYEKFGFEKASENDASLSMKLNLPSQERSE